VGSHAMKLKVALGSVNYPTLSVTFTLLINQATCDCNLIVWDNPAKVTLNTKLMKSPVQTITLAKSAINVASETATPAIRSCTGGSVCTKTSAVVIVDKAKSALDAAFMTFDTSTLVLTVEPTLHTQIGTYTMKMTQTV